MTQTELADRIGIAHQSVSKWECGIGYPDVTLFPVIAEVLSVPISVLFGEEQREDTLVVQIPPCGSSIKCEEYSREGYTGENLVHIHTGRKVNITSINYLDLTTVSQDRADGSFEVICK